MNFSLLSVFFLGIASITGITGASAGSDPSPELKKRLTPLQYQVTQLSGTEPPYKNEYWNNKEPGIYVDRISGEPLFSSVDKFDSETGWPSFTRPIEENAVRTEKDRKLGMERTEVRARGSDSHLGHVFEDGPKPTGKRYCMNSASLRFVPAKDLVQEGYGRFAVLFEKPNGKSGKAVEKSGKVQKTSEKAAVALPASATESAVVLPPPVTETAVLAGGCFWGVQHILRKQPGVVSTEAGYAIGKSGTAEKAEAVRVVYDPARITYDRLLEVFFKLHDPTTLNQQGNDKGPQYRSAVFVGSSTQKKSAEKAKVIATEKWKKLATTEITELAEFQRAEEYHQDYLVKNPKGYTCHYIRDL